MDKSPILSLIQERYPGYHPLVAIADIAHSTAIDVDSRLRFDCHKAIAKYIEPELKSIEVKGQIDEVRHVRVSLFEPESVVEGELVTTKIPDATSKSLVTSPLFVDACLNDDY